MSGYKFQNTRQNVFNYLPDDETKEYLIPELNQIVSEYSGGICDSLTNNGRDCLQSAAKYKFTHSNNIPEHINCTNYCFEQIMNWLPRVFMKPEYIIINYDNYEKVMNNISDYSTKIDFYFNNIKELEISQQNFSPKYKPKLRISNYIRNNNSFNLMKNYFQKESKYLGLNVESYGEMITLYDSNEDSIYKILEIFKNYLEKFDKIKINFFFHCRFSKKEVPETFGEVIKNSIITVPDLFELPPRDPYILGSGFTNTKTLSLNFDINFQKNKGR